MRAVTDILFDVTGQTLYYDAQEGRPSSVTSVEVFPWDYSDTQTSEWSASGSVETNPNTTLDDSAAAGSTSIPLTATTGIAQERRYLITGAASLKEWVEIESITSGASVTAKHPLHNSYVATDTFQSTRITATVDSTWVADITNLRDDTGPNPMYRVRWVYVVSGVTYVADSYFNLVRYAGKHGVMPQDMEVLMPGWLDTLPTDHRSDQGRRLIDDAYRAVKLDLHQIDTDDSAVAEAEIIDELTRYKALQLSERARFLAGGGDLEREKEMERWYSTRLDSLVRVVSRVPVRDVTGAAAPVIATGLTRR